MRPGKLPTVFLLGVVSLCGGRALAQTTTAPDAVTSASSLAPASTEGRPLPTATELLKKYENASGGREAWSSFTSRFMKGIYQTEDASSFAAIEVFSEIPDKSFTKISFPNGLTIREVCDGNSAWLEDPRGGMHEFTGAALESRLRAASFNGKGAALLMMLTGRAYSGQGKWGSTRFTSSSLRPSRRSYPSSTSM